MRLVMPVVALAVRRVGSLWGDLSAATFSEIVQEVFLKVCEDDRRILREFEDRGNDSLLKLMRVVAASVATDHFRNSSAEKRGGRHSEARGEPGLSVEDLYDHKATDAVEWPTLMSQIDSLLESHSDSVSLRDRNLFWLYYRQGMTAEAISRIPSIGLTVKGVESALLRLTRLLRETILNGRRDREVDPLSAVKTQGAKKKIVSSADVKGFSSVVSIDRVKRR